MGRVCMCSLSCFNRYNGVDEYEEMKIPILNIYIMTEATFEAVIKKAAAKAHKFSTKQLSVLLKDNERLARGLPERKVKMQRSKHG